MLRTARSTILELDASSPLDDNTNGRLVHIYSALHGHDGLSDNTFGGVIGVRKGAFSIRRTTESYQWIEHESEEETRISSTHVKRVRSYSYNKRWRTSSPAYLSGPGAPHNPTPRLEPGVVTTLAEDLTLDNGVVVPSELLAQLKEPWIQVPLNAHASGGMPAGVAIAPLADSNDGARSLYLPISGVSLNEFGRRADSMPPRVRLPREVESTLNFERIGTERPPLPTLVLPPKPVVGDARVTFHEQLIPPEGVSIIAQQASHGRLMPWSAPRTGTPPPPCCDSWASGTRAPSGYGAPSVPASCALASTSRSNGCRRWWRLRRSSVGRLHRSPRRPPASPPSPAASLPPPS